MCNKCAPIGRLGRLTPHCSRSGQPSRKSFLCALQLVFKENMAFVIQLAFDAYYSFATHVKVSELLQCAARLLFFELTGQPMTLLDLEISDCVFLAVSF